MLSITSWNILAPLWVHSDHFPNVDPSVFTITSRRKSILRTLRDLNTTDIFCLQEVQRSELENLMDLESMFDIFAFSWNEPTCWKNWLIDRVMEENGTIVLLRKNKFSNVEISRAVVSEDGNAVTLLKCHFNGAPLFLVNSHLDTDCADRRERQIQRIQTLFTETLYQYKTNKKTRH